MKTVRLPAIKVPTLRTFREIGLTVSGLGLLTAGAWNGLGLWAGLVAGGSQPDLVTEIFGGIVGRYRGLTEADLFRRIARDGWSNTKLTLYSATGGAGG